MIGGYMKTIDTLKKEINVLKKQVELQNTSNPRGCIINTYSWLRGAQVALEWVLESRSGCKVSNLFYKRKTK
jgi:hypothetical protein